MTPVERASIAAISFDGYSKQRMSMRKVNARYSA
jgi:hypothetical protein